ncbi:MAG: hypothetical protein LKG11_03640 [Bacilli bacterium]|jgi:hypothetical protein|nr:hypothetical protein [Bacilli bacterium]
MNQISEVIATLVHYKVVVRDTMEYCLPKDKYDTNVFKEKKRSILVEIEQPTPLKNIIDHSKESGPKLEKLIRDFYDEVYGDDSTILKLADDGLRVDHAQHLSIYKGVLPIHENVEAMIRGIIADGHKQKLDITTLEQCDRAEEKLYRGVSFMTLTNDLVKLFGDYNQARQEAKGEETPASRFIGNDIQTVIGYLAGVRQNSRITDNVYMAMQDDVFKLVDSMTGHRDLPAGKNFGDVIKETQAAIAGYVKTVEPEFRAIYVPVVKELVEQAQKNGNKIIPDAAKAATPAPEAQPIDMGDAVELDPKTGLPKA